jgi:hypothetical protein
MSVTIFWNIPTTVTATTNYTKVRIYRATSEQNIGSYILAAEIESRSGSSWINTFTDLNGTSSFFFHVRYFDPVSNTQTQLIPAYKELTPREARLVDQVRRNWLPPLLVSADDNSIRDSLVFAVQLFNMYPPVITEYTIDDFPQALEMCLLQFAQVTFLFGKYLNISFRDFSYSDNGLSLTVDRGGKMQTVIDMLTKNIDTYLKVLKLNFAPTGIGIGTVSLPISLGGTMNRGVMNALDVYGITGGR